MNIKTILQILLLAVIAITPFVKIGTLYFPFVSGKAYLFRFLVLTAFFFWIWYLATRINTDGKKINTDTDKKNIIKKLVSSSNLLVIGFLLFLLAQVFVSFFGVSPELSFFSTIERQDGVIQYGFWVLYFLMLISVFKEKKDWKILFSVFIVAAILVSLYAWFNLAEQSRLHGIFGNPSYLAAYLLFAIGFCAIVIERRFFENNFINWIFAGVSGFFGITLFYTQTRGAYFGLAAAVFLFCLLSALFLRKNPEKNGASKKIASYSTYILIAGLLFAIILFSARETDFIKNRPLLSRVTEVVEIWEVGAVRERILNWQIAFKAFKEKPIFGYGPENFMAASNKYYDHRISRDDPWFDRTHNQFIEPLATGGVILFSFYIFLLACVFYAIFKISKKENVLSFIFTSVFLAYIIQGVFLFDTLPVYLGLFPFLAFVTQIYTDKNTDTFEDEKANKNPRLSVFSLVCISVVAIISLFGIYATVLVPYTANAAALKFLAFTSQGFYKEAVPFAEKSFSINSPYTSLETRKRIGWQFLGLLEQEELSAEEVNDLRVLYNLITPELERFVKERPFDSQIYYVLPRIYRFGYEKLGENDLERAETLLKQAFTYSDLRVEYYNEMAHIFLLRGRFEEGEPVLKDYVSRVKSFDYFPYLFLGHYYYLAGKYDLAFDNYEKAREADYDFCADDGEYSRYIDSADKTKNYQEIVDMSLAYINFREQYEPPNADVYFNVALGYYYLGDSEKAKEFFLKTLELNKEQYQQYSHFFGL